ncbi:MAG TPA: isoprenylcysteine carboxylmethyltransferase family protein, partial [Bauldia sp.]|nr:isoprenylcysteine carboxylmethyltransferase family protein [Bauldia sp.]
WSSVPDTVVVIADLAVVAGFWMVFRTFQENGYASSIIEVRRGQSVITTGPYALVRHPMYSGALLLLLATPVALGSWWGLLLFPLLVGGIVARLRDEERYLRARLPAYADYAERTRFRLIPFLW